MAVKSLREAILALLGRGGIVDVAFIGSASDVYEWVPSRIVDFDALFFVERRGRCAGDEIQRLEYEVRQRSDLQGVDFELRVIQGAYKPHRCDSDRPIVLAHLGVYEEPDYLEEPVVKRWGWRKYPCEREAGRLARLSPPKPTRQDVLYGRHGVSEKLNDLRRGETFMVEWVLPDFRAEVRRFDCESPVFVEFCHGAAATTARHHARLHGRVEADRLGNEEFFAWYDKNILPTESLLPLMELKARSRNEGFGHVGLSRRLSISFLEAVEKTLSAAPEE